MTDNPFIELEQPEIKDNVIRKGKMNFPAIRSLSFDRIDKNLINATFALFSVGLSCIAIFIAFPRLASTIPITFSSLAPGSKYTENSIPDFVVQKMSLSIL